MSKLPPDTVLISANLENFTKSFSKSLETISDAFKKFGEDLVGAMQRNELRSTKAQRRAWSGALGDGPEAAYVVLPNERTKHEPAYVHQENWDDVGIARGFRGRMD